MGRNKVSEGRWGLVEKCIPAGRMKMTILSIVHPFHNSKIFERIKGL
jgi:hypothetical protein